MSTAQPSDAQRFSDLWDRYAPRIQAYALRHVDREVFAHGAPLRRTTALEHIA